MADGKTQPKAMDVVHAGATQPSPSGRPVIVSNRPYIKIDPMLNAEGTAPAAAAQPPADVQATPETVPKAGKPETSSVTETAAPQDEAADQDSEAKPLAFVLPPQQADAPAEASEKAETVSGKATDHPAAAATGLIHDDRATTSDVSFASPDTELPDDILQTKSAAAPDDEAAKAREEELEQLIAAKTYAVPINKTGRRKKKILLWSLLFILFGIIALDLLADMGVFSLPFGIPHTNFLSN